MSKEEALQKAREMTQATHRKYVVREDYGVYLVVPLYLPGREGYAHDAGYAALGLLVKESL